MLTETTLAILMAMGIEAVVLGVLGYAALCTPLGPRLRRWSLVGPITLSLLGGAALYADGEQIYWLPPMILAGGWWLVLAGRSLRVRSLSHRFAAYLARPRAQWAALVVSGLLLTIWCLVQAEQISDPVDGMDFGYEAVVKESLKEASTVTATTDRGRRIPLFKMPATVPAALANIPLDERISEAMGPNLLLIRTAPPAWDSNCHGWTYAGGRWWVNGSDVANILKDNGYRRVNEPRPKDLVIYRGANELISHSAVVFAVHDDGLVLLESKWGHLGRYIHRPTDQPYGKSFAFYRSSRSGHLLRGIEPDSAPTAIPHRVASVF